MQSRYVEVTEAHKDDPAYSKAMYRCARALSKQTSLGVEKCLDILEGVGPTYVNLDDHDTITGLQFFRPKVVIGVRKAQQGL